MSARSAVRRLRSALTTQHDAGWTRFTADAPEGMTAEKLRYIAKSLDLTQRILLDLAPKLRIEGKVPDGATMETFTEWLAGTDQQDDLRRWADELETGGAS